MNAIEDILRILFGTFIVVMTVITVVRKMRSGVKNHYEIQESIDLLRDRLVSAAEEAFAGAFFAGALVVVFAAVDFAAVAFFAAMI